MARGGLVISVPMIINDLPANINNFYKLFREYVKEF